MSDNNSQILAKIIDKYSKRPLKKPINPSSVKKNYKFSEEERKKLKTLFETTNFYPDKNRVKELSDELGIDLMKIENWFKYERRKMLASGKTHLMEKRKKLTKIELGFLKSKLKELPEPSHEELDSWAKSLSCSSSIIRSWFRNIKKKHQKITDSAPEETKECQSMALSAPSPNLNMNPNPFILPTVNNFMFPHAALMMSLRHNIAMQNPFFYSMNEWNPYDFHL